MAIVSTAAAITFLVGAVTWFAKEAWTWAKEEAHRAARAAGALLAWSTLFSLLRAALFAAVVLLVEAFATYILSGFITPLAGNLFARLLPSTSAGEFFHYIFWDSGLHAKRIVDVLLLYLANYTILWAAFDRWLRGMAIALATYQNGVRRAEAVLRTSLAP